MINNNIQEDYCSFEVSKLLREKEFDVRCQTWYTEDGEVHYNFTAEQKSGWANRNCPEGEYTRPTHSLAIKWIRENFIPNFFLNFFPYTLRGKLLLEVRIYGHPYASSGYKTESEATEAGLKYTLENLINDGKDT
jgi:hypothetical protein